MRKDLIIIVLLLAVASLTEPVNGQKPDKATRHLEKKVLKKSKFIPGLFDEWKYTGEVMIDSIQVDKPGKILNYYFSSSITHMPLRTEWIENRKSKISMGIGRSFRNYRIQMWARDRLLEDFVPNAYRDSPELYDQKRMATPYSGPGLVANLDRKIFKGGLSGRHIALWPSHGFFFDQQLDRWQWQRARLWETVEDIFPWSVTSDYLIPMLENSGATVLMPRERDTQIHEVIVDNDSVTGESQLLITNGVNQWEKAVRRGFMPRDTLFPGQNPFDLGSGLSLVSLPGDSSALTYIPDIPEAGEYAVYVSWVKTDQCINQVRYEVAYTGGKARFAVNQCMGAGTWVYLGTFQFNKGVSRELGSVVVYGGDQKGILTADAVRFGGGMGSVARGNKLSGKPRWMEGSRYYLQYAGMPDSLVYNLNAGKNDYNDDYLSRGEWVNYLIGPSKPQYSEKYSLGLSIPVDLALAFHTDAGVTANDSIIGTLGIYSSTRNDGVFPNGQSKLANRDLADLVQTQVVDDIRKQVNPCWTHRGLWDREYSEAWRPIVPVMLLELLSHQNLADMRFGLDPRFKFIAARAIYKGMLRYLAVQDGRKAVIQPLPPNRMAIEVLHEGKIRISWSPVADPLENTAKPDGYNIYMKQEDNGFAPGIYTKDTFMIMSLPDWGKIYSFRVTGMNDGGESLPGETLSAALFPGSMKPVLVVNAFDRISGPAFFDNGNMAGIAWWEDEGVADGKDFSHSGNQYDFSRNSNWLHDDSPGWGASDADRETLEVMGNTFSFPLIHGKALRDAGYPFVSVSDEVFESPGYNAGEYRAVDIIFGEERGTESFNGTLVKDFRVITPALVNSINRYISNGGNLFISGAYIGTDMIENKDSLAIRFASDVLHYSWRTNHATRVGSVTVTDQAARFFPGQVQFNTADRPDLYKVESPDAIEPSGDGAIRIYRYTSGGCSAGVAYKGSYRTVVLGFPFETVLTDAQRTELMKRVMEFFTTTINDDEQ
jgi:hypothetical protein